MFAIRPIVLFTTILIAAGSAFASPIALNLSAEMLENQTLPFIEHVGPVDDRFGTTLAMNVQYDPILSLRDQLREELKLVEPLRFFTGFAKNGEAHVTVVTPVEYHDKLRAFVAPERMNEIATRFDIQASELRVLGLGKGEAVLGNKQEQTYFVIVKAPNLLRIRRAIYREYIRNGGPKDGWNPDHFFPHVTVGYTARDLHEDDGILKDVEHSLDARFMLEITEKPESAVADYSGSNQALSYLRDRVARNLSEKEAVSPLRNASSFAEPNDPRFTYAMAAAAFAKGSVLEQSGILGEWIQLGVAFVPEPRRAGYEGSYSPDGIFNLPSGPKKYPLVFRLESDVFGGSVLTATAYMIDLNTKKTEATIGPVPVSFGQTSITFEIPASSRQCHTRSVCKALQKHQLLCGTYHADLNNPCLDPMPNDKEMPFKFNVFKKSGF